jgi:glucose dehydrogenase
VLDRETGRPIFPIEERRVPASAIPGETASPTQPFTAAIVPVNRIAGMVQLIPREGFDLEAVRAKEDRLGDDYEYNMMRGTPYVMRRRALLAPSRLPCTPRAAAPGKPATPSSRSACGSEQRPSAIG